MNKISSILATLFVVSLLFIPLIPDIGAQTGDIKDNVSSLYLKAKEEDWHVLEDGNRFGWEAAYKLPFGSIDPTLYVSAPCTSVPSSQANYIRSLGFSLVPITLVTGESACTIRVDTRKFTEEELWFPELKAISLQGDFNCREDARIPTGWGFFGTTWEEAGDYFFDFLRTCIPDSPGGASYIQLSNTEHVFYITYVGFSGMALVCEPTCNQQVKVINHYQDAYTNLSNVTVYADGPTYEECVTDGDGECTLSLKTGTPYTIAVKDYTCEIEANCVHQVDACTAQERFFVKPTCSVIVDASLQPKETVACYDANELLYLDDLYWVGAKVSEKTKDAYGQVEFTNEDGLVCGKEYALIGRPRPTLSGLDFAVASEVFLCDGVTEVTLPGYQLIEGGICDFFDIEPGTSECTLFVEEFADPVYVANTISVITKHEDLAGNERPPETLDYVFLPIVTVGAAVPVIPVGKAPGLFSKYAKKSPTMGKFFADEAAVIQHGILKGDEVRLNAFLGWIDKAGKSADGSAEMADSLKNAKSIMDDCIVNPGVTDDAAIKRLNLWIDETAKRLDNADSKTSKLDVFKRSGVSAATKKVYTGKYAVMNKITGATVKHDMPLVIHGKVYDFSERTVVDGTLNAQIAKGNVKTPHGLRKWIVPAIGGVAIGWICVMGPWYTLDNVQFIVYVLREAGCIDATWGNQWNAAVADMESAYYSMKDVDPCIISFQDQYLFALERQRTLMDGAEPIPEDKVDKAKYTISILYGQDIGDPNELLLEACEINFKAWNERYYHFVSKCDSPQEPPWGWGLPEHDEHIGATEIKVVKVIDGDTIDVMGEDLEWPHGEAMPVRFLGVNTPDIKDPEGYEVCRIDEVGATRDCWDVSKECRDDATQYTTDKLLDEEVGMISDPNNQYGKHRRFLAIVMVDGVEIAEGLLTEGHGAVFFYSPNALFDVGKRAAYLMFEEQANATNRGIWSFYGDTGTIKCVSNPYTAAEVYLDKEEQSRGTTVSNVFVMEMVPLGSHTVTFKKLVDGETYACTSAAVNVTKDTTVEARCEMIPEGKSIFWITSNPTGARIYIDDIDQGDLTPSNKDMYIDPGKHTFKLEKSGYGSWEKEYKLEVGEEWYYDKETKSKRVPLVAVTPTPTPTPTPRPEPKGKIHCKTLKPDGSSLSGSKIYVTGGEYSNQYFGDTERTITVPVGTYSVSYEHIRYKTVGTVSGIVVEEGVLSDGTYQFPTTTIPDVTQTPTSPGKEK